MKTFSQRLKVRSYELDAQGHVNYAVYLSYLEYAQRVRWRLFPGIWQGRYAEPKSSIYRTQSERYSLMTR